MGVHIACRFHSLCNIPDCPCFSLSSLLGLVLCPSLTVLNLLPNEDESTIQVCSDDHSWSFQSIPIHSNGVLLMFVGSAGELECFEYVQTFWVASANKFHSCLCALKTCSYRVCRTAYVLYSSHSHCVLTVFWLI